MFFLLLIDLNDGLLKIIFVHSYVYVIYVYINTFAYICEMNDNYETRRGWRKQDYFFLEGIHATDEVLQHYLKMDMEQL